MGEDSEKVQYFLTLGVSGSLGGVIYKGLTAPFRNLVNFL